jgi:uncharacterized protein with FMN-binding domain
MSPRPWRGTLIFVGAAAAIAAAGVGRFAGAAPEPIASAPASGTDESGAGSTGAFPAPSTDDGSSTSAAPAPTTDGGSGASTSPAPTTPSDAVTIVGSVAQTRYGPVQVSVTFAGGEITDVQTLQAPDRERRSSEISQQATPILAQEVLSAQSAQIDTVSGATYTTEGYRESVQAAIDQRG